MPNDEVTTPAGTTAQQIRDALVEAVREHLTAGGGRVDGLIQMARQKVGRKTPTTTCSGSR
jgi:hypothetical protein